MGRPRGSRWHPSQWTCQDMHCARGRAVRRWARHKRRGHQEHSPCLWFFSSAFINPCLIPPHGSHHPLFSQGHRQSSVPPDLVSCRNVHQVWAKYQTRQGSSTLYINIRLLTSFQTIRSADSSSPLQVVPSALSTVHYVTRHRLPRTSSPQNPCPLIHANESASLPSANTGFVVSAKRVMHVNFFTNTTWGACQNATGLRSMVIVLPVTNVSTLIPRNAKSSVRTITAVSAN